MFGWGVGRAACLVGSCETRNSHNGGSCCRLSTDSHDKIRFDSEEEEKAGGRERRVRHNPAHAQTMGQRSSSMQKMRAARMLGYSSPRLLLLTILTNLIAQHLLLTVIVTTCQDLEISSLADPQTPTRVPANFEVLMLPQFFEAVPQFRVLVFLMQSHCFPCLLSVYYPPL